MRFTLSLLTLSSLAALATVAVRAAEPAPSTAEPAWPPALMANAPAATITVEDIDGGARVVFKAHDAKEVEVLRAWARRLAEHFQQGCPPDGRAARGTPLGMGPGAGKGRVMQDRSGFACPRLGPPPTPPAPASTKKP